MSQVVIGNTDIPLDGASNAVTPIYSQNRLLNGDASNGLNHWEHTNASIASNVEDALVVFKLGAANGIMTQEVPSGGVQPTDFKIGGIFLPDRLSTALDVKVKAFTEVVYTYADGSKDVYIVPVRGAVNYE